MEHWLNILVTGHSWLAYFCDYYYATLHFVVTIGVLVWIYVKHPLRYRSIRSVLFATNLIALVGFWASALPPPGLFGSRAFTAPGPEFTPWASSPSVDFARPPT